MKKILYTSFLLTNLYGLQAQQAISLKVNDTRSVNELPSFFNTELRTDFKLGNTINLPEVNGLYSATLTIAPWGDASGGTVNQLNFSEKGLFYRNGFQGDNWRTWKKLVMENSDGSVDLGKAGGIINIPAKLSVTNDVNVAGAINVNHISTGNFVLNNNSNHSTMTIGKEGNDNIIADNSPEKHYGGGFFFRVHTPSDGYIDTMLLSEDGNVGIGVKPKNKLDVNGTIHAREVKVDLLGWADYVFKKDYDLPSLESVEQHIKEKGHLPSIPSEQDVLEKGINLGDNQRLLLQKIEELTLYSIEQNKQIKELKEENKALKQESAQINSLLERVEQLEKSSTVK